MAFYKIDRANAEAIFASEVIRAIQSLNQLYGQLVILTDRMDEMTPAQIETYHGLPGGSGTAIKAILNELRAAIEQEEGPADRFRTELG